MLQLFFFRLWMRALLGALNAIAFARRIWRTKQGLGWKIGIEQISVSQMHLCPADLPYVAEQNCSTTALVKLCAGAGCCGTHCNVNAAGGRLHCYSSDVST
ncbi:uncharacterized protein [Dermacentor andersoni]|uniref:uncharacterized protein n=1 Tax=Dermacentor andersoni TaxID=34620 RepID=UPI003B3B9CCB